MPIYELVTNEREIEDYFKASQLAVDAGLVSLVSIANHLRSGIAHAGHILGLLEDNEIIEATDFDWHKTLVDKVPTEPPIKRAYDDSNEHLPIEQLYEMAVELARAAGFSSRGQLMRRLQLRLDTSGALLEPMESRGVILGFQEGSSRWQFVREMHP